MRTLAERFWEKVEKTPSCWLWTASLTGRGYGQIGRGGRGSGNLLAHRVAYELQVGPIPEGMQIDHLCRNRLCVRGDHLQPVDARTNLLRAPATVTSKNAAKTHCVNGHEFSGDNLIIERGVRACRACRAARLRARRAAGKQSPSEVDRRKPCTAKTPGRCKCRVD